MTELELIDKLYKELANADSFSAIHKAVELTIGGGEPIEYINPKHLNNSSNARIKKVVK